MAMKSISINLITAPTVRMPLLSRRLHKALLIVAFGLFLALMILVSGGIIPLVRGVSEGALATIIAPLR